MTDRSMLFWRIFSVFIFASRRSSAFINSNRFRSFSVFLFSRRTGGLCETFVEASSLSSLLSASASEPAHSFNHVVYQEKHLTGTTLYQQVTRSAITEVWSKSFGLVLHAQHIFAKYFKFLVTRVTVFHFTCIFCVYGMALYWPKLQFCMRVRIMCLLVCGAPWSVLLRHSITLQRVLLIVECGRQHGWKSGHAFSALCVYSKFGHNIVIMPVIRTW